MTCSINAECDVSKSLNQAISFNFSKIYVEMMGLIGAGNNPMVGMTVACAVAVEEAMK